MRDRLEEYQGTDVGTLSAEAAASILAHVETELERDDARWAARRDRLREAREVLNRHRALRDQLADRLKAVTRDWAEPLNEGVIIAWAVRWREGGRVEWYAAVKCDGLWWTTSVMDPRLGMTWEALVAEFLRKPAEVVVGPRVMTVSEQVPVRPGNRWVNPLGSPRPVAVAR